MKLQKDFYLRSDVVEIARDLIGKVIYTQIDNQLTAGIITETEAYAGVHDKASHAYNNRRTNRTEVMYREGGVSYIYLCYGVHYLFNFVTNHKDIPHAVLLRGIVPYTGLDIMKNRTGKTSTGKGLTDGPGKVTKALGLHIKHNGLDLSGNTVWVTNEGIKTNVAGIKVSPRIGVQYAGEDAKLPYRFLYTGELL
jgi:DNA-3-methyladenine glycosylase